MLERDELAEIIEEYHRSLIQSEAEVSSKLIVSLTSWLGYPSQLRAEQFPVYGNSGRTELPAKPADFILFDNKEFGKHKTRTQSDLDWVKNHSLLIIEAKKPGEMPNVYGQAQYYSHWTRAVGYIYIDGDRVIGFLLGDRTADISIINCDISSLVDNENILQFSYDNIKSIKEKGIAQIASLVPIQYKKKISTINEQSVPDCSSVYLIPRHIVPYGTITNDEGRDNPSSPFVILEHEQFIVLLGSAGQGKTYTLYQIFHEAEDHGYHPFFYQLGTLPESNVLYSIAEDKLIIDEHVALIFDGFDEIAENRKLQFIQSIEAVRKLYPEILIMISSRENIYSKQFNSAWLYTIQALTDNDINLFLSQAGIDVLQWTKEIQKKGLNRKIYANPFNLSALKDIWIQEGSLPDETRLMRELVDLRINTDINHVYSLFIIQKLKQSATRKAFQNMALVMQCMHRYYLTEEEVDKLFDKKTKNIMVCHGLWNSTGEGFRSFVHNNYQEYLAAEALAHMDLSRILGYIANPPDKLLIRPSWIQVLAYLTNLYKSNDLQEWVFDKQPEFISLFKKDRFTEKQKTTVIRQIINKSKEQDSWIKIHYSHISELVSYCSTSESVDYITNELQQEQTDRQKQNLLRCLSWFSSYYQFETTIKQIVSNIAFNEDEAVYIRCDAFRVMTRHPALFDEYITRAADLALVHKNEYFLYEIVEFIDATGKAEDYIDSIIDAYDKYDYYNNHLISLYASTYSILESIQGKDAACKIIRACAKWLRKSNKRKEDVNKLIKKVCDIGIRYYDGENDLFLSELLSLFQNRPRMFDRYIYPILINYIEQTHTERIFLNAIISNQPSVRQGLILSQLICDSMTKAIEEKINDRSIAINTVKNIITYLPYKSSNQTKLINAVYLSTQEEIIVDPPIDYAKNQQAEHQRFFDALFDKALFDNLVSELLTVLGKDSKVCEESFHVLFIETKMEHMNEALYDCYFALQHLVKKDEELYIQEYKTKIDNWDDFCFYNAEKCIENHTIEIDEDKKEWLTNYCIQYLTNVDLDKAMNINKGELHFDQRLAVSTKTFKLLSVKCTESLALKLLSIPAVLFDDRTDYELPECVTSQIHPEVLKKYIVEYIHKRNWNRWTAPGLINYCKKNRIMECRDEASLFILDRELNGGYTYPAIDYMEELFGIGSLLTDILPHCNNDDLLSDISARIPNNASSELLDGKLWDAYNRTKDNRWIGALIKHNNADALQEYYKRAEEHMSLPDMVNEPYVPEITETIREVNSSSCIPVLINLLILSYSSGFTDRESFGLKSICWDTIRNIAKDNYESTRDALTRAITDEKSSINSALHDLLNVISDEQKYTQDNPLTFEFAKQLVMN